MINLKKLKKSFGHAIEGLQLAYQSEQSFRVQLVVAIFVLMLMFFLEVHAIEKAILILVIGFVLGLELLNSQLEKILDLINPEHHPKVKAIKDLSAAAVLVAVGTAVIIGLIIFSSYLS